MSKIDQTFAFRDKSIYSMGIDQHLQNSRMQMKLSIPPVKSFENRNGFVKNP